MSNMFDALVEAGTIANDDTHGYNTSAAGRLGPNYDCSSFVAHCLIVGGYSVPASMSTYTEVQALTAAGFVEMPVGTVARAGDIVMTHTANRKHTALIYDSTRYVHASSTNGHPETGDQTQKIYDDGYDYDGEIKFTKFSGGFAGFNQLFRDPNYVGTPGPKPPIPQPSPDPPPAPPDPPPGPQPPIPPSPGQPLPAWLLIKIKNNKENNL